MREKGCPWTPAVQHPVARKAVFVRSSEPVWASAGVGLCACLLQSPNICASTTAGPSAHGCGWGGPEQVSSEPSLSCALLLSWSSGWRKQMSVCSLTLIFFLCLTHWHLWVVGFFCSKSGVYARKSRQLPAFCPVPHAGLLLTLRFSLLMLILYKRIKAFSCT